VRLFCRVCDAVQYAHGRLIVHRDLKPANIFVSATGDLKLLDFGIAKLLTDDDGGESTELTRTGVRPLTPAYAAPEQLRDEPLSTATDVYALGVILCELLTARRPFAFASASSGLDSVSLDAEPPRPSDVAIRNRDDAASIDEIAHARGMTPRALAARLAGDLDAIVLKALRGEPQRRYVGAGAFAEDLERFLQAGRWRHGRKDGDIALASLCGGTASASVAVSLVFSDWVGWQRQPAGACEDARGAESRGGEDLPDRHLSRGRSAQASGRDITLRWCR
jgi:serine/threonine-protein kinase